MSFQWLSSFIRVAGTALIVATAAATGAASPPPAANPGAARLNWIQGPARVNLRTIAQFRVPEGYVFLDEEGTRALLRELGDEPSGEEIGFLAPASHAWFAVLRFLDFGYVREDEKRSLDADALWQALWRVTESSNARRRAAGALPIEIEKWDIPPRYDAAAHRFEWAVIASAGQKKIVNHVIGELGRSGAVQFYLVDQQRLASTTEAFRRASEGFFYRSGESYVEWREGDRRAQGGSELFVTGGRDPDAELARSPTYNGLRIRKYLRVGVYTLVGVMAASVLAYVSWRRYVRVLRSFRKRRHARLQLGKDGDGRRFDSYNYYQDLTRDLYRRTY